MPELVEITAQIPRPLVDRMADRLERLNGYNPQRRGPDWELQHGILQALVDATPVLWTAGDTAYIDVELDGGVERPWVIDQLVDEGRQAVLRPVDPREPWACVWTHHLMRGPEDIDRGPDDYGDITSLAGDDVGDADDDDDRPSMAGLPSPNPEEG